TGPGGSPADPGATSIQSTEVGEVVVTAQKREENLKDVPVPVSVVQTKALVQSNQVLLKDYVNSVPSFSLTPVIGSEQSLSIRGVTTGGQAVPTVGILVDDIPFGDSTRIYVPELDPGDLERIEVLRGPQGTLYGSNAMGGLLKYDTIQPSTDAMHASLAAGLSGVQNGDTVGYNVRGSINAPLGDRLALRVSAFDRLDPGYIDNVLLGKRAVNQATYYGGLAALKWSPIDDLSVTLRGLYQHSHEDASSDVDAGLGDLKQNEVAGAGVADRSLQAYSATINGKAGIFNLVSLTGYSIDDTTNHNDLSARFSGLMQHLYGVGGAILSFPSNTKKFSQEVRASFPVFNHLDATAGLFYTHENLNDLSYFQAVVPTSGQVVQNYVRYHDPLSTYEEYAAFGNLDYHFNDKFDVQLGLRGSHINNVFAPYDQWPGFTYRGQPGVTPQVIPGITATASPVNYLVTPRYRFSPDAMVYFRFATGYRPGGANPGSPNGVPLTYAPDQTKNYELGVKADFLDNHLSIDTSIYYIDWSNIQIQLQLPVCADPNLCPNAGQLYEGNGGSAKSEGVEFQATLRPFSGLTLNGYVSYDDAVLTQDFPAGTYGKSGDRLPFTPKISWRLEATERVRIAEGTDLSFGGDVAYVSDRICIFQGVNGDGVTYPPRDTFPSYTVVDLRAGLSHGSWTYTAYVTNALDERALIGNGGTFQPGTLFYNKPRTYGLNVAKSF
ncbi:MAG: TonB-dependent receptor plug domain-containing protein, partial [Pseudomonadota bacterium]|nr:TonB-dependent receptor plug domain-containing protein [Pseudomonadota bacterium]